MSFRLSEDEAVYQQAKLNDELIPINQEPPIFTYTYWRMVHNRFPHTKLATVHVMIVLNREAKFTELTSEEWLELYNIMLDVQHEFDIMLYNFPSMSSVKNIPHIHLQTLKQEHK
jgi:hypothetical protein